MGAYGGGDSIEVNIDNQEFQMPKHFALAQNYPNPFNVSTIIQYNLPVHSNITIDIYDILGRKVKTLVDKQQQAGYHTIDFDASELSSGVYFYRLQAGDYIETKKMILLK